MKQTAAAGKQATVVPADETPAASRAKFTTPQPAALPAPISYLRSPEAPPVAAAAVEEYDIVLVYPNVSSEALRAKPELQAVNRTRNVLHRQVLQR